MHTFSFPVFFGFFLIFFLIIFPIVYGILKIRRIKKERDEATHIAVGWWALPELKHLAERVTIFLAEDLKCTDREKLDNLSKRIAAARESVCDEKDIFQIKKIVQEIKMDMANTCFS
ncbi:MAG: hypothetical protein WC682_02875 [Parcubacteria group bacterium]|jgi:hypothetical protein